MNLAGREILEFPLRDTTDTASRSQPERSRTVVVDVPDVVAQQAVFGGVATEHAVTERVQTATESADPQGVIPVLQKRSDFVARQAICGSEPAHLAVADIPQSLSISSGPNASI